MTSPVPLIVRAAWGARSPDGFRDRPMPVSEYWLHHSVTVAPDLLPPFDDDDAAVRTLERIGQARFGGGISYTYPVTPTGRLYEGHSLHRQGAHTKGHNTVGAAFVLVGDYSRMAPTAMQRESIARRMVEDHRAGRSTTHYLMGGHRDVSATSCPGNAGYAAIDSINARARILWAAGHPNPIHDGDDELPTLTQLFRSAVIDDPDKANDPDKKWSLTTYLAATYRNARAAYQGTGAILTRLDDLERKIDAALTPKD